MEAIVWWEYDECFIEELLGVQQVDDILHHIIYWQQSSPPDGKQWQKMLPFQYDVTRISLATPWLNISTEFVPSLFVCIIVVICKSHIKKSTINPYPIGGGGGGGLFQPPPL